MDDLTVALPLDSRTSRLVARKAQGIRSADAAADREIRRAQARAKLARERRGARTKDRRAQDRERDEARARRVAARRGRAAARAQRRRAAVAAAVGYVRGNAPGVYAGVIYAEALAVAVTGQVSTAAARGWPTIVGVAVAVFVEGMALSMALTAHQCRMRRERALVPRALTWLSAIFAATINYWAHSSDPVLACVFAASSLSAITVWEVRSGAKYRPVLRKRGMLPEPPEQFGWRRWLRYLPSTFQAWSLDIRGRVSPPAGRLLAQVDANHAARLARRQRRRVVRLARWAVRWAALRGDSGAALAHLVRLAHADALDQAALAATPQSLVRRAQRPTRADSRRVQQMAAELDAAFGDRLPKRREVFERFSGTTGWTSAHYVDAAIGLLAARRNGGNGKVAGGLNGSRGPLS